MTIPDLSFTAETLSRWLRRSGTLSGGTVTDVRVELKFETAISHLNFLTASYSAEAPPDLPRRLVVKSPLEPPTAGDTSEPQFYTQLAPAIGTPPLARCLAAIEDDDLNVVVLEDLRATHDHPPWPLPPSELQCKLTMNALARVHAPWWEAPTLGDSVGKPLRIFSQAGVTEGIRVRIDDKLSRVARGKEWPGDDVVIDLVGYLALLAVTETK